MPNLGVTSRSLVLTAKGWSASGPSAIGELFRGPCIDCGTSVSVTRFGAFTGAERHSSRQCSALISGRTRPRIRKAVA